MSTECQAFYTMENEGEKCARRSNFHANYVDMLFAGAPSGPKGRGWAMSFTMRIGGVPFHTTFLREVSIKRKYVKLTC